MRSQSRTFIGVMTGTSVDGLDIAAIGIDLDEKIEFIASETIAYPTDLRENLLALSQAEATNISSFGELDAALGRFIGISVNSFLWKFNINPKDVQAIGSHGQTIRHQPPDTRSNGERSFTLQIGDPNQIAYITKIITIADFRRMDMAAGGQGAPLVPLFHQNILKKQSSDTALVNIGGIANITYIEDTLLGYDIGPGNCLVDAWCQRKLNKPYDDKGHWARTGKLNSRLLKRLLDEPYFCLEPPKSSGKELFNLTWLTKNAIEYQLEKMSSQDVQRTLLELTAVTISKSVKNTPKVSNVIVCGGGRNNEFLMERISSLLNFEDKSGYVLEASEHWGLDGDSLEASAFAWLAFRRLNNLVGTVPSVTGAKKPSILGAVYTP
uniref:Anhydro-N-acetylmuramic acid kinase n=1 Tax=uncultured gamma proteobacterium HF0070_08D07 TaxID=710983 RepID=E0XRY1_9GAMM|nr:predicted molecular chaperone distantly related to hsp70-fold metalloproteases [uncultured gamma proteobacterium HF0070_08D07]